MKKSVLWALPLLTLVLTPFSSAAATNAVPDTLHVVKSSVNAEPENAELCIQFDKPLAPTPPTRLTSLLKLDSEGKKVVPANIDAAGTALCLFPLAHGKTFHLELSGLRGGADEKMAEPYTQTFTVPDRPASLAFTGKYGGVNGFGSFENALTLRSVNISHVKLIVYRIADVPTMAHAWQERAQTALVPSESAYLGRTKGEQVWQSDLNFDQAPNTTNEQKIVLRDQMPQLTPGLYLIVADAGNESDTKVSTKGLAPLAAAWFAKSDFSMAAYHDGSGVHVYMSKAQASVHLSALNKKPEEVANALSNADGSGLVPNATKGGDEGDIATIVAVDGANNVAFADNEALPPLLTPPPLGAIRTSAPYAAPSGTVNVVMTPAENAAQLTSDSMLRLMRHGAVFQEFPIAAPGSNQARLSFYAPPASGQWDLRWQKNDGTSLANSILRVTSNGNAPHLESSSDRDFLTTDAPWPITIKSLTSSGTSAPLVGGRAMIAWQEWEPSDAAWKGFHFGTAGAILDAPQRIGDFVTDLDGTSELRLVLPKAPAEPGLYQAVLTLASEPDSGVAPATPLTLPLHPDATVVGIKPLVPDARFAQNGIARFALIGLASDGKPRDVAGLSYQIYEEGRSFGWFQNDGQWKYKPEPQLRPIGGAPLSIKSDGTSILEWPVTAGNYRLEILDPNAKVLAQSDFSAGWDSSTPSSAIFMPLSITVPKILQPGQDTTAHFTLPTKSMLTVIIADDTVRKSMHEVRDKGPNDFTFVPSADWKSGVNIIVAVDPVDLKTVPQRTLIEASVAQSKLLSEINETGLSVVTNSAPSAIRLRKDGLATIAATLENNGDETETYHYVFTSSPGLKLLGGDKGNVTLGGRQSRLIEAIVGGDLVGPKDLKLEIVGPHIPRTLRSWTIDVLSKANGLRSAETTSVAPKEPLIKGKVLGDHELVYIGRRSMDGLAEILSSFFVSKPFTTEELALSTDALRLWGDILTQSGFASESLIAAQKDQWIARLLLHQNDDGGFPNIRGGQSTLPDTASALLALGPLSSAQIAPAKMLAIAYLKQHLSNTWFDDKERTDRASAYAGLAAAGAIDPANLHYFSDTTATDPADPIAAANIAAAFKQIRDPNAAAFWIKKMLETDVGEKSVELLNALSATDALSSDDVHKAMIQLSQSLRSGKMVEIKDVGALLRAIAIDNTDAGSERLLSGPQAHDVSGVAVLHFADPTASSYRNGDNQNLFVTSADRVADPVSSVAPESTISRHVYKLSGPEISPRAPLNSNDIYLVELKGTRPHVQGDDRVLISEGDASSIRPIGCALPPKLDPLSFAPALQTKDLSVFESCERLPYALHVVLNSPDAEDEATEVSFRIVYFAHIDAKAAAEIAAPQIRILRSSH